MKKAYMTPQTLECVIAEKSPMLAGVSNSNVIKDGEGDEDLSKGSSMWEGMSKEE